MFKAQVCSRKRATLMDALPCSIVGRQVIGSTPLNRGEVLGCLKKAGPSGHPSDVNATSRSEGADDGPAGPILPQRRLPGQGKGRAREHSCAEPAGAAV